jgi:formylglycine-generating enzyme
MAAKMLKNSWGVWALALSTMAAGCRQLLGLDEKYDLIGDGGSGGTVLSSSVTSGSGGPTGTGMVGTLGERCPQVGVLACAGNAQKSKLICGPDGKWATNGTCDHDTLCDTTVGVDQGTCKPAIASCAGRNPGDVVCDGRNRVSCGPDQVAIEELETCPNFCSAGVCEGPSCAGLSATCGLNGIEGCCAITAVPGGTFNRDNDTLYPATVSDYMLDRFEITVGRFRAFVKAYPGSKPVAGVGSHPLIAGSGWDATWDKWLPADQTALMIAVQCGSSSAQTWTDAPGPNENLPMNCITWYLAFAFCAWDGGRLPTEAEWNYAAAGGSEQRDYPWGSTAPDANYAVFDVITPAIVGSKPSGDSKWGQSDLAGSMVEWILDWYEQPYRLKSCNDCADTEPSYGKVVRGGGWKDTALAMLSSYREFQMFLADRQDYIGARCARTP